MDGDRGMLVKTFRAGDNPAQLAYVDNALWVTNMVDGVVRRIDQAPGETEREINVGHTPFGIAVADGRLFVTVSEP